MANIKLYYRPCCTFKQFLRNGSKYKLNLAVYSTSTLTKESRHVNVIKSPFKDVKLSPRILTEFIWENLDQWPDRTAIVCGLTGRGYSYSQLFKNSRRFAVSLQKAGLKHGDVMGIIIPNCPEYAIAILGAIEAGLTVTIFNTSSTSGDIARQMKDAQVKFIVASTENCNIVKKAIKKVEQDIGTPMIALIDGHDTDNINFQEMISLNIDRKKLVRPPHQTVHDIVLLPYSSGTTGLFKGVMLSHWNLVANIQQLLPKEISLSNDGVEDVVPAVLPFFHIYGLVVVLFFQLYKGSKIVTLPKFDPKTYLEVLLKHDSLTLYVVPALVDFLNTHPDVTPEHLERVRTVLSGAAPLGIRDAETFLQKVPKNVELLQAYGMTEMSPVVTHQLRGSSKVASVGPLLPETEARIVDLESGLNLGPGRVGELYVRGPQMMKGYLNNEKATSDTIDSSGWLHTGDLAYYDEDGHFYVVDRTKELIKVKGHQVAPAELEDILRSHPLIADAAVIGIPSKKYGEVPKAFVVPSGSITEEEVAKFVEDSVTEYKQVKGGVQFLTAIPRTASGKIKRQVLKKQHSDINNLTQ